jgi:hypothetical protein
MKPSFDPDDFSAFGPQKCCFARRIHSVLVLVVLLVLVTYVLKNLSQNLKVRDHLECLGVDKRTVLKLIVKQQTMKVWTECTSSGQVLINMVISLRLQQMSGNFLTSGTTVSL